MKNKFYRNNYDFSINSFGEHYVIPKGSLFEISAIDENCILLNYMGEEGFFENISINYEIFNFGFIKSEVKE